MKESIGAEVGKMEECHRKEGKELKGIGGRERGVEELDMSCRSALMARRLAASGYFDRVVATDFSDAVGICCPFQNPKKSLTYACNSRLSTSSQA